MEQRFAEAEAFSLGRGDLRFRLVAQDLDAADGEVHDGEAAAGEMLNAQFRMANETVMALLASHLDTARGSVRR